LRAAHRLPCLFAPSWAVTGPRAFPVRPSRSPSRDARARPDRAPLPAGPVSEGARRVLGAVPGTGTRTGTAAVRTVRPAKGVVMTENGEDATLTRRPATPDLRLASDARGEVPPLDAAREARARVGDEDGPELPRDRNQAILEAAKQVGAVLKRG